jgi:hypothetical protein
LQYVAIDYAVDITQAIIVLKELAFFFVKTKTFIEATFSMNLKGCS